MQLTSVKHDTFKTTWRNKTIAIENPTRKYLIIFGEAWKNSLSYFKIVRMHHLRKTHLRRRKEVFCPGKPN